jgi:hypothetical protein
VRVSDETASRIAANEGKIIYPEGWVRSICADLLEARALLRKLNGVQFDNDNRWAVAAEVGRYLSGGGYEDK